MRDTNHLETLSIITHVVIGELRRNTRLILWDCGSHCGAVCVGLECRE